jgi:hypothetical protein
MQETVSKKKPREGFQAELDDGSTEPSKTIEHEPEAKESQATTLPEEESWPITVRLLHKPVRNPKGEYVKELSFREPTGGDINRYGNPCRINADGDVVIDERKMTLVMAALAGILQPHLEAMDPRDWNSCAYRLRGFFLPEAAAWFPTMTT